MLYKKIRPPFGMIRPRFFLSDLIYSKLTQLSESLEWWEWRHVLRGRDRLIDKKFGEKLYKLIKFDEHLLHFPLK